MDAPPPAEWPFRFPLVPVLPARPVLLMAEGVHDAFVNRQIGATRLVTTQALYLGEEWHAALAAHGAATLVATAERAALEADAPEVLKRRGVWADADVRVLDRAGDDACQAEGAFDREGGHRLARAFRTSDPAERRRRCAEALEEGRTAAALLATASACMEANDLEAARRDIEEAVRLAPAWAAAHFERGKLGLRREAMDQAAEAFRAAVERLPRFGPAWANLGATLGELDRPAEALAAIERALSCDPASPQAHGNLGVLARELGQLARSEGACRAAIRLAPDLAFGYYNLGHTLFLQGRFQAALSAYAEGQARDRERNPVQGARLALCRLATGDGAGALDELQRAVAPLPGDARRQVLADIQATLLALVSERPALAGWQAMHGWIGGELTRVAQGQV
jgi:tetratricopeptide (TPR) repeat protein